MWQNLFGKIDFVFKNLKNQLVFKKYSEKSIFIMQGRLHTLAYTPKDATEVRQFLGLASYYRRYVLKFAEIVCPLNNLMQKGMPFLWSSDCEQAFLSLKEKLIQAPVLACPKLGANASTFTLETDASAVVIGAVLEQDGHPVAYVSRALKKAEKNYSVIQQECLAIVFAMKQFRHYLLGRPFTILTDHAPVQWAIRTKDGRAIV